MCLEVYVFFSEFEEVLLGSPRLYFTLVTVIATVLPSASTLLRGLGLLLLLNLDYLVMSFYRRTRDKELNKNILNVDFI
jgi:hypothetical protein